MANCRHSPKSGTLISLMVFVVSLIGMMISLLSTLNERRREMSIQRSVVLQVYILIINFRNIDSHIFWYFIRCDFSILWFNYSTTVLETKLGLTVADDSFK